MTRRFYILSGGTFSDIRPHLALAAPAFGKIGRTLLPLLTEAFVTTGQSDVTVELILTRMALGGTDRDEASQALLARAGLHDLLTNEDVAQLLETLTSDPETRGIILTTALTDFNVSCITANDGWRSSREIGRQFPRLHSRELHTPETWALLLDRAYKLVPHIRKERKDIFLVACKTTTGATADEQYLEGLALVKGASCNLVLGNDLSTRNNVVITPEQARYHETTDRNEALRGLAEMIALRSQLHFTRSTVVPGEAIAWSSELIPETLRTVVDHCIAQGAYKPFNGTTVGHFATRGPDGTILTSRRKTNFNELEKIGLVQIETRGEHEVIAHGFKPSVGGQSQRAIFTEHPEADCIVHFHCPLKEGSEIPVRSQRPYECGSHECGENTSSGLKAFGKIKAVMLDQHGPNIVFPRDTDPAEVIRFIEANVNLRGRTDGLAAAA